MSKKLCRILILIVLFMIINIKIVDATQSFNMNSDAKMAFDNFFSYINRRQNPALWYFALNGSLWSEAFFLFCLSENDMANHQIIMYNYENTFKQ